MDERKRGKTREIAGRILFVSLVLSVVFSVVRFIQAPAEIFDGAEHTKVKSDYLLMLLQ